MFDSEGRFDCAILSKQPEVPDWLAAAAAAGVSSQKVRRGGESRNESAHES